MSKTGNYCVICNNVMKISECSVVKRGLQNLIEASKSRNDNLYMKFESVSELILYKKCRKNYTRKTSIVAFQKAKDQGKSYAYFKIILEIPIM